jgi:hypothetical protein
MFMILWLCLLVMGAGYSLFVFACNPGSRRLLRSECLVSRPATLATQVYSSYHIADVSLVFFFTFAMPQNI